MGKHTKNSTQGNAKYTKSDIGKQSQVPRKYTTTKDIKERWSQVEDWAYYKAETIMTAFMKLGMAVDKDDPVEKDLQWAIVNLAKIGQLHDMSVANAREMGFWGADKDIYKLIDEELAKKLAEIKADAITRELPE